MPHGLSTSSRERFYGRNKPIINRVIRGHIAKTRKGIVHGTKATNAQLPKILQRKTRDWDIKTENPLLSALQLEKKLDKKFRGDFFRVEEGATKALSVHKVKSNINDKTYADFSKRDEPMPWISKRGVRFATLKNQVEKAKKLFKDPSKLFRREKDIDLIRRVRKFEKMKGESI